MTAGAGNVGRTQALAERWCDVREVVDACVRTAMVGGSQKPTADVGASLLASLAQLQRTSRGQADDLEKFDVLCEEMQRCAERWRAAEGASRIAAGERLDALKEALAGDRSRVIDAIVANDRAVLRGERVNVEESTTSLHPRASVVRPRARDYASTTTAGPSAAKAEIRQLISLGRELLESLAGLLRFHAAADLLPWPPQASQQRQLACMDAFWSLHISGATSAAQMGLSIDVLKLLEDYVAEQPNNAERWACRGAILGTGCDERSAWDALEPLRRGGVLSSACVTALIGSPHPRLDAALQRLCRSGETRATVPALQILSQRGAVNAGLLAPLALHPSPAMRVAAAHAAARLEQADAARALLTPALDDHDDRVAAAAAESLVRFGDHRGVVFARNALERERALAGSLSAAVRSQLFRVLALAGEVRDAELLLTLADSNEEILALGWAGHASAVPFLISRLRGSHWSGVDIAPNNWHAWHALQRIVGHAGATVAAAEEALPERPRPERWSTWWEAHRDAYAHTHRWRFGEAWRLQLTLDELSETPVYVTWRFAELELALGSAGRVRLPLHGWAHDLRIAVGRAAALLDAPDTPPAL